MDSNFQYREHHAMAPSRGFAAASHREAALRGAPSHGETAFRDAAGFREARRLRSTDREMRCSAAVQAARYRAARRAAMRSAPCEIRPGENVTLQYLSHAAAALDATDVDRLFEPLE